MTAARGRGKSAAMGLSVAAAVAHGYSNIFVTSPSPENLKTLFEFVFKGFDALNYQVWSINDIEKKVCVCVWVCVCTNQQESFSVLSAPAP